MPNPMPNPIPITDQIACLTRKLRIRVRIYPHLVRRGTMTQAQMDHDLACLQAVLATLQPDEADGPWPDVIDRCPCPDCATPLLWTVLNDVRTAWQVHHCPPREEQPHA